MKFLILDFYVDEPACFGVPPYLSPYIRYIAGALVKAGISEENIDYLTIDKWRENNFQLDWEYDYIYLVAGTTVPGRYLGGKIGSVAEILKFLDSLKNKKRSCLTLIGGPVRSASNTIRDEIALRGGILIRGDLEVYASLLADVSPHKARTELESISLTQKRTYKELDEYAVFGAFITEKHPNFPYLILEIETYRGCTRNVFCSFCSEAFYGRPVFRSLDGILGEIEKLYKLSNRYFRLGRQADLMTYLPNMDDFKNSFPRPIPQNLYRLYSGIREVAPDLKLLHLDNINPGLIATFPNESEEIIKIITEFNTEGDTAAMGIESVDDAVIQANDLKCNVEEAKTAIRLINKYGKTRVNGIPKLLPGLNFIHGLAAETSQTFQKNYEFLLSLLDEGLLLRRINIRQVVVHERSKLSSLVKGQRNKKILENKFVYYKDKIRKEIDEPMLKLVFPVGSVLKSVIFEKREAGYLWGRQLGSYPITVKMPETKIKVSLFNQPIDVVICGHVSRAIYGLPYPLPINSMGDLALRNISGFGSSVASKTTLLGPYQDWDDLLTKCPEGYKAIKNLTNDVVF
ncbi:MAG: radical SAM protein [Leptospiraceae bacterium]|nr:radical SAM protein [Leptospiraceae bacterium]